MAATRTHCGSCQEDNIIKVATVWCVNCKEGLCEECRNFHRRMKNSRMPKTVDVSAYEINKTEISRMTLQCEDHDQTLDLFCPNHLLACCMKCVSNDHSKCTGIISLQSAIRGESSYSRCDTSCTKVATTLQKLQQIIENRRSNLERTKQQKDNIKSHLSDIKDKLIKHFEKLESIALSEVTAFEQNIELGIKTLVTNMEKREQELLQMQTKEKTIEECSTPELAFVENLRIQRDIAEQNEYISDVFQEEPMSEVDLQFDEKINVSSIFSGIDQLVDIQINKTKCSVQFSSRNSNGDSFAQIASGCLPNLSNVHVTHKKEIDIPVTAYVFGRNISNIGHITNGLVIVCDYNSEVVCIDQGLGTSDDVDVPGNPWDVVQIGEATIAISYPQENAIKIINTDSFQLITTLSLSGKGRGISFTGKNLVVGINGKEIQFLDPAGPKVSSFLVDDRGTVGLSYIHFDNGCIYCSDYSRNAVQCYDTRGGLVWEYQNNDCLKSPRGICSDQYGNLFVVGLESNNIVCISRDGKCGREVYDLSNDVKKPKSISFDKTSKSLVVTNESGDYISIYHVEYLN